MALELVTVMWITKDNNGNKDIVFTEIPDDTVASRNQGLSTLGYPNNTNKDPILTNKQFTNKMKQDYPQLLRIVIVECLKNTLNNKYYYLHEITEKDLKTAKGMKSKEVKEEKIVEILE